MADQRILYTEEVVGAGHPTKPDTLNRLALVEHNNDGTHKDGIITDLYVEHNADGTQKGFAISGTNTYTGVIGITAYTDKQSFDVVFTNASTAASTLNLDSVGAKKLYIEVNGAYTQVGNGDIFIGMHATVTHDSALDAAAGGFIIRNKRDRLPVEHNTDGTHKTSLARGFKTSNDAIVNASWSQISLGGESYDTDNEFVTSVFTANRAGKYSVKCAICWSYNATGDRWIAIYVNDVLYSASNTLANTNTRETICSHSDDVNLAVGDTIKLYCWQGSGGNLSTATTYPTFLSIARIG